MSLARLISSVPARATSSNRQSLGMDGQSALIKLGFGVLAFNSALAIRNSWGDAGSVSFVLAADAALALLFLCLRRFERDGGGRNTKAAVWALTTLLTTMFASRVAPLMPTAVAALVWAMSVATAAGGFWAFFLN